MSKVYIQWLDQISVKDVPIVGGKNASLGELIVALKSHGVEVPDGFATTSTAYVDFISQNKLAPRIRNLLDDFKNKKKPLNIIARSIRQLFLQSEFPTLIADQIRQSYQELCSRDHHKNIDVAVRSSATAEDLPTASFAGQQETFLNVTGEKELLEACRKCFASLFTDRAIVYREEKGFDHLKVALSIGVQKMVRSDLAGSGVMFTIDTETGFPHVVVINAAFGLGELVVQGSVDPDEIEVFKPLVDNAFHVPIIKKSLGKKEKKMIYGSAHKKTKTVLTTNKERHQFVLTDDEVMLLARWAKIIEKHYGKPMDIEWAKDGRTKKIFIVQARPETVQSQKRQRLFTSYVLKEKGKKRLSGVAIGEMVVSAKAQVIRSPKDLKSFASGSILVTSTTDPDWMPVMKKAAGIITDHGGRTSHAAIVSRELGIPAIVGTGNGTQLIKTGETITLSCAEGEVGFVYEGALPFEEVSLDLEKLPKTKTDIMMNMASPEAAFHWWQLPTRGIGLARMEFIISDVIKIHPMALLHQNMIRDKKVTHRINKMTQGYRNKSDYFIDLLSKGISKIAASQFPHPVIVRMSDFKTNEYSNLIGGQYFEPIEENPMIGFRGASRYYHPNYRDGFALECAAIKKVREEMGFLNVVVMIPFCRTLKEADQVLEEMKRNGLVRGENGLEVYVMCEIPSNVILADQFSDRFDGFSIGSNDLTQLTLGVDRDSSLLASLFDERNEAVKELIREVIKKAHLKNRKVGICGQAPSDYPEFAEFLVECGIDSISLNPDSVLSTIQRVMGAERKLSFQHQV